MEVRRHACLQYHVLPMFSNTAAVVQRLQSNMFRHILLLY
jgi:hypothetical protein